MMQRQQLLVALVLCGSLLFVVAEAKSQWENVLDKLEASSRTFSSVPTELKYDDYQAACTDLRASMSSDEIEEKRQKSPLFRLFHDFVLVPMERLPLTDRDGELLKEAFVKRLEQTCKRFWSGYIYKNAIGDRYSYNGVRIFTFIDVMQKLTKAEPTLEMWQQAFDEYSAIKNKIDEIIRHEDVYDHLDELQLKMNYINDISVKYVIDLYSEKFNKCKTTEDMKPVVEDFRKLFNIK